MLLVTVNATIVLAISVSNFDVISQKRGLWYSLMMLCGCFAVCFGVNVYLLHEQFREFESDTDLWVLAMTLLTDMTYLAIYSFFKTTRAVWLTLAMIVVELTIFSVAFTLQDDSLIDSSNMSFALITSLLSLVLWSGRLSVKDGETRFYDYYEMRDYPATIDAVIFEASEVSKKATVNV
jgi:lysylphosphatidylglycerol synthetase-like protein (DUF2156 family)